MKLFSIVRTRLTWYGISAIIFLASLGMIGFWGLPLGIDFVGGSLVTLSYQSSKVPSATELKSTLDTYGYGTFSVQPSENSTFILRSRQLTPTDESVVLDKVRTAASSADKAAKVDIIASSAVGPSVGSDLRKNAIMSLVLVLIAIVGFITWAFRHVSEPVASWKYGMIAVLALVHDVVNTTGAYVLLGKLFGAEIDTLFVTALLTVLGFSVHDTIVVFDRTRENLKLQKGMPFEDVVDMSVRQTFGRSVSTSFTTLLVLLAVIIFGGATIRWFATALFVGIFFGTYSSIFLASPMLVDWKGKITGKK